MILGSEDVSQKAGEVSGPRDMISYKGNDGIENITHGAV